MKISEPWDSHRYFHENGDSEDDEDEDEDDDVFEDPGERSSAYSYSTSDGYTSANGSLGMTDQDSEEDEYESGGESDWDLEDLMETFVAFEGADFGRDSEEDWESEESDEGEGSYSDEDSD